jgi:hypothetical protein
MVSYRRIKPEEIKQASDKFVEKYPWAAAPNWLGVVVKVKDGEILGLYDLQVRATIGNLVNFDNSPVTVCELAAHADSQLINHKEYEWIVPNQNESMQKFLEKHYGLEGEEEIPHKIYIIKRD